MRGVFVVDEPTGERWELALDLLRRGEPFSLGQVTIRRINLEVIEVAVASEWWPPEALTEGLAREPLARAREGVEELLATDLNFKAAVGGSTIDYILIADLDISTHRLCRLVGDDLVWLIPRPG